MQSGVNSLANAVNDFQNRRFGMFIHFGLYSQASEHEWHMHIHRMTLKNYKQRFLASFNPDPAGIASWVATAKQMGAKYIVVTAKHCDGFCLWDTAVPHGLDYSYHLRHTAFWQANHTGILDILMKEARKEGIRVGFYYAIADWSWTERPLFRSVPHWIKNPKRINQYRQYIKNQLVDLLQKYPDVFLFWFDCFAMHPDGYNFMDYKGIYDLLHKIKPDILIGCNTATTTVERPPPYFSEFIIYENMADKGELNPVLWPRHDPQQLPTEACLTLNNHWGYNAKDKQFKVPSQIVRLILNNTIRNGNTLLNLGPMGSGFFNSEHSQRADEIGEKIIPYKEFVYNTRSKQVFSWGGIVENPLSGNYFLYLDKQPEFPINVVLPQKVSELIWIVGNGEIIPENSSNNVKIVRCDIGSVLKILF